MTGIYIPVRAAWYDVNIFYYERQWLHPPTLRIEDWIVPDNTRYTAEEMAMYTGDMFLIERLKKLPPGKAMFLSEGPVKREEWHPAIHHMSQQRADNEAEAVRLEEAVKQAHKHEQMFYDEMFATIPEQLRKRYAELCTITSNLRQQKSSMEDKLRQDKEW